MASLEDRVSRVEGVIEQMNERLGNLERGIEDLRADLGREMGGMRQDLGGLRHEMQSNFRWMLGTMLVMWVTIIGVVAGALLVG